MNKYTFKINIADKGIDFIIVNADNIRSAITGLRNYIVSKDMPWYQLSLYSTYCVTSFEPRRYSTRRLSIRHFDKLQTLFKEFINE